MNGNGYLLDTNAIIQFFDGNSDVINILRKASSASISIISELEFLSFSGLTDKDMAEYDGFRSHIKVFDVPSEDPIFTKLIVSARKKYGLKLPDAIFAATARQNDLTLLTADDHFKKLKSPWRVQFYVTEPKQSQTKGTTTRQ